MNGFAAYRTQLTLERDRLKLVKAAAKAYQNSHTPAVCYATGMELYQSDNFQIQEVGVFLLGYAAQSESGALAFLRETVSSHENRKVQETLAMAFDLHCKAIGYETALPLIQDWLSDSRANVRRAASEGLRVWTSRPYFKGHPEAAVELLSTLRSGKSEYVRKSIGNALKDISKKYPQLVRTELHTWDLAQKDVRKVYRLAGKFLPELQ